VVRDVESRRWDSLSRRWSARSSLRFSCSVVPPSVSSFFFVGCLDVDVLGVSSVDVGGFEDCLVIWSVLGCCERWKMGNYHECFQGSSICFFARKVGHVVLDHFDLILVILLLF
jgi:hypothetical protein